MSLSYEELDFQITDIGELMLRRRRIPQFPDLDIYEIKLAESFLMSSLFHQAEQQLAKISLSQIQKENLNVVVGGLGLGYTAVSALEDPRIQKLTLIEYLQPVIDWHLNEILPLGKTLKQDPRCSILQADFFKLARAQEGFQTDGNPQKHDVILLDIDHKPNHWLHSTNSQLYTESGLQGLSSQLHENGVFGLWADGQPDPLFTQRLAQVFSLPKAHCIDFFNPITGGTSYGTVYTAIRKN